ncbi:MAG: class I SAM-dependent methyltransferase [Spirochaetaceae bacterium]|jgi:ubiquinone/menaquinone biosynthesis C-methylase UbiE|nr:class I SAM-dependent methyltransferase [Spirochaetaceae bacterium]
MSEITEKIIRYWNDYAPEFDEAHATEDLDRWKATLKSLIGEGEKSVLDAGTGTGFLAKMTAQIGYRSTGVDLSEKMMEIGKEDAKRKGLQIAFVTAPVEKLPFPEETFDAVINCRLVWTLPDPQTAFLEWRRVLKTGGQVLNFIRIKAGDQGIAKEIYGKAVDELLPLKNAGTVKLIAALENAGFSGCEAIPLPKELTFKPDMDPWYAIKGVKA